MKKTITARHNANNQVVLVLKNNETKVSAIPILKNAANTLEELVNETNSLLVKVDNIPGKTSGNKSMAREELAKIAYKLSCIAKTYAFVNKDENLGNFLAQSESELVTKMRHQEVLAYANALSDRITPIVSELADYGCTEGLKTELDAEIKEFSELINEPRQLISERKTTNELIEEKIAEIYSLVSNQIDPLMELFVDDKEFYLAYKSARMIVDPASRKKDEKQNAETN